MVRGAQGWQVVGARGCVLQAGWATSQRDDEKFEKRAPEFGDVIFNDWQQALRDCASLRRAVVETLQSGVVWAVIVVAWAAYVWWSTRTDEAAPFRELRPHDHQFSA